MGIIAALIIGGIAGWLAGLIVRGAGFGLIGNIVIGIIGALLASWLLPQLGVSLGGTWVRDIVNATIGAVIILVILSLITRGARFYLAAFLLHRYGAQAREIIEKRLGLWTAIGAAALVGGFLIVYGVF